MLPGPAHSLPDVLLVAAALLLPAVFVLLAAQEPEISMSHQETPTQKSTGNPVATIALVAFIGFLRVMGEGAPRAFINVYLDAGLHVPLAQIGLLIGIARLLAVPAGLVMPAIAARWGTGRTVAFGALGVVLGLLPLALIPHWLAAGLGFMAMTALAAISRSAFVFAMNPYLTLARHDVRSHNNVGSVSSAATAYGGRLSSSGHQLRGGFSDRGSIDPGRSHAFRFRFVRPLRYLRPT